MWLLDDFFVTAHRQHKCFDLSTRTLRNTFRGTHLRPCVHTRLVPVQLHCVDTCVKSLHREAKENTPETNIQNTSSKFKRCGVRKLSWPAYQSNVVLAPHAMAPMHFSLLWLHINVVLASVPIQCSRPCVRMIRLRGNHHAELLCLVEPPSTPVA